MKIDKNNPPEYLRQTTTGRIYPYSSYKADRADMEPYVMPKNEPIPEADKKIIVQSTSDDSGEVGERRLAKIKEAIAQIPVEEYGVPTMGRPAMPKVAKVSELAGFKVSVDEIVAAMG